MHINKSSILKLPLNVLPDHNEFIVTATCQKKAIVRPSYHIYTSFLIKPKKYIFCDHSLRRNSASHLYDDPFDIEFWVFRLLL